MEGDWVIDTTANEPLNRAARDWHRELFRLCAAGGREVTVASSMELVLPPDEFAARFPDGTPVRTDTGFASLNSTHCAFSSSVLEFQKAVFASLAGLMSGQGLTPDLQFGEFLWWYFTNWSAGNPGGGMGYYDAETQAATQTALGRALHTFQAPTDDPNVNAAPMRVFLRNRLRDYVAALGGHIRALYPQARLEVLFPYDVNYPVPAGMHQLGRRLEPFRQPSSGMAKQSHQRAGSPQAGSAGLRRLVEKPRPGTGLARVRPVSRLDPGFVALHGPGLSRRRRLGAGDGHGVRRGFPLLQPMGLRPCLHLRAGSEANWQSLGQTIRLRPPPFGGGRTPSFNQHLPQIDR